MSIALAHLALWCPYCDDMVNPETCADVGLPKILRCRACGHSIAHCVPDDEPEAVRQVLASMAAQSSEQSANKPASAATNQTSERTYAGSFYLSVDMARVVAEALKGEADREWSSDDG